MKAFVYGSRGMKSLEDPPKADTFIPSGCNRQNYQDEDLSRISHLERRCAIRDRSSSW